MSMNLLESVRSEISPAVVDKISNYLNESRGNTSNALTAAIPSVLAFVSEKTKTDNGASSVIAHATDNEVTSLFSGHSFKDVFEKNRDSLMTKGNTMLKDLFGNKEQEVSTEISKYANVSKESANGILASVLPLIMSVIGSKVAVDGLSASNISNTFEGEKETITSAIPAGLASLSGILGLGAIGGTVSDTTNKVTSNVKNTMNNMKKETTNKVNETKGATETYIKKDEEKSGIMKWLLPLLGLIAAALLIWFLLRQCNDDKVVPVDDDTDTIENVDNTPLPVSDDIAGTYDSETNRFIYDLGDEREITLPTGISFNVGEFSSESKIYDVLSDENAVISDDKTQGWITLDKIYFVTDKAELIDDSKEQLDNLASLLEAYPNVEVKFGGYTDNRGGQEINQPLSEARANAAKDYVASKGIDASRLDAEGYGQDHPVCPANDTEECMAKNRRTAIRITKK